MGIKERTYSGKDIRPRPEIHIEKNNELLIVATPWGPRGAARKAIKIIQDFFLSSRNDIEATSPFKRLTCLSANANDLRTAVKLANDTIYSEENKNEYVAGIELTVIARSENELCWVQIGYPYMFLDRPQSSLKPLGNTLDLATEMSITNQSYPPLPQKLLGLESSSDFSVQSLRPQPNDRLILVSRSNIPQSFFQLSSDKRDLENITQLFSKSQHELAFWLGIYST